MKTKIIKKRNDFYSLVFQALDLLIEGKESELLIFNIWGPQGSGKTYALKEIKNRAKELDDIKVLGPYDVAMHSHRLLDEILVDVHKTSPQSKKMILLDNLKSIIGTGQEDPFIHDVEDQLISPMIANGDTIIVVSSLHEIKQWRSLEVRVRHKIIMIPPLETRMFRMAAKETELNFRDIYKKTVGHPKLLEWLVVNPFLTVKELDNKATDFFLSGLDPETKKIAQVMSLSFSFNIPAYQKAVSVAGLKADNSYFSDLKKIKEMCSLGLIIYESSTGMYRFSDPKMREILARSFRREFPDIAQNVYQALAELSHSETNFANALPSHFLNAIYYQLWGSKLTGLSFSEWLDQWFSERKESWKDVNWNEVSRAIIQSPSSKYMLEEIKKLAGRETYTKIIQKVHPGSRIKK